MFGKIINSPWIALFSGVILALSSGYEVISDIEQSRLGAHHGVFIYGFLMALRALSEFHRGLKEVHEGLGASRTP